MANSIIKSCSALSLTAILVLSFIPTKNYHFVYSSSSEPQTIDTEPTINDPNLKTEVVFKGLQFPTSLAFLGPNDILVLEKNNGTVQRIINGNMLPQPMLQVPVANKGERGMLGIAVAKNATIHVTYIFIYYTKSGGGKTGDDNSTGTQPLGNFLYKYELVNNKLVNPKLLLKLPTLLGTPNHNGGKLLIGSDRNLYVAVGDADKFYNYYFNHLAVATKAQNIQNGGAPDGTGGILILSQDGKPVKGIIGDRFPVNLYYAYGIRNSFGMDFDPVTKKLWDAENGPDYGDEINLVEPGFNSGWAKIQGIWENNGSRAGPLMFTFDPNNLLTNFGGKGKYRSPEFIWDETVSPTGLVFLNSTKLGQQYKNDMFVGDYKNGNLYHFKLNHNRTKLDLHGSLADRLAADPQELQRVIFGSGFGGITDVKVGPDGCLYILSYYQRVGTIFKISPVNQIGIPPFIY
jgi:aldose sugar dehydrogenase